MVLPLASGLEDGQNAARYDRGQGRAKRGPEGGIMIIAVDFDGVLCKNQFPEIGPPRYEVISLVRELIDEGHEVVLWTTRNGYELTEAVKWCDDRGLHFCTVNEPAPSNYAEYADRYPTPSRKIYADIYIDDHNLEYVYNARSPEEHLIRCIRRILNNEQR